MSYFTINNDCLKVLCSFEDNSVDVSFTSPPYNRKRNDKYSNYEDTKDNYFDFLVDTVDELLRVTKGHVIFNIQKNYYNKQDVFKLIGHYSNKIQEIVIWEKSNPMPASGLSITNAYEMFIVFGDTSLKSNKTYTKNVITTSVNSNMPKHHKAVMKQEVSDWFIEMFTKEGDIVLDCFMGLGTTGKSCLKNGRKFIGIEQDIQYFNEASESLENIKSNLS